ncbi:uncharacterized protein LOC120110186 [Phoenix dactylifera]|uniref:Uncharacterized protein LOC103712441 n=1 Tax=Phoenix dactylifera TaxID=42345 RepID=A0A8B7CDW2_PHODC|nr:uncharacterized protein LOC103712441 [Phoenix dactylifera]XP_038980413.1 uncharacterized protein LOC120110186 [Phoenix dactylifera]
MELQNPSNGDPPSSDLQNPGHGEPHFDPPDDIDSACSTPYVSAPSSPGRGGVSGCYFFSAPTSPMHYVLSSPAATSAGGSPSFDFPDASVGNSFEFEFSARFPSSAASAPGSMTSADELFLNGQIRPMKLSSHLQRPQVLAPLFDLNEEEDDDDKSDCRRPEMAPRGRDLKLRSRSIHRRARSHSPLRNAPLHWQMEVEEREERAKDLDPDSDPKQLEAEAATPSVSASSSRSSSTSSSSSSGRTSKKWIFLKDLLYRSRSEGRERGHTLEKFWHTISFSQSKEKSRPFSATGSSSNNPPPATAVSGEDKTKSKNPPPATGRSSKRTAAKSVNGLGRRRGPTPSPHERHYTANRAQAEEMRRKTFLPYRQGLLGCLGFSSRSYGAINGLARTLHPVSSR